MKQKCKKKLSENVKYKMLLKLCGFESVRGPCGGADLAKQQVVDGQAGQQGHLSGLAVAAPGLKGVHGDLELLLLDGGRTALQQPRRQADLRPLQQLTQLTQLPEVWTYAHIHTQRIHSVLWAHYKSITQIYIKFF